MQIAMEKITKDGTVEELDHAARLI